MPVLSKPELPDSTVTIGTLIAQCYALKVPNQWMKLLINQPCQRVVTLRPNGRGEYRTISWSDVRNCEAMLIQAKGDVAKSPCRRCSKGAGPMTECVTSTVRGEGACANCFYHGNGHKCSFRASEMPESRKDLAPKEVPVAEEEDEDEVPRIRKRSQLPRRGQKARVNADEAWDPLSGMGFRPVPEPQAPAPKRARLFQRVPVPQPAPVQVAPPAASIPVAISASVPAAVLAAMTCEEKREAAWVERELADVLERSPTAGNRMLARYRRAVAIEYDNSADEDMMKLGV